METSVTKRGKYHEKWNKNDTILSFFCEKWGATNLVTKSNNEDFALEYVANHYIGSTLSSLKQQMLNIKFVMTNGQEGLSCFSRIQKKVYDEFNGLTKSEFQNFCLTLIEELNSDEIYSNYTKTLVSNQVLKTVNDATKKLTDINETYRKEQIKDGARLLNKNPKKLVSLEEYMKKHPDFVKK